MKAILITGTPGTGKTTLAKGLASHYKNKLLNISEQGGLNFEVSRGVKVIDVDELIAYIDEQVKNTSKRMIIEGHLSHYYKPENTKLCFVLRCDPYELRNRLKRRGYSEEKIKINLEAESMDLILQEALQAGHTVHEINTTQKTDEELIKEGIEVIDGRKKPSYGSVDFTYHL